MNHCAMQQQNAFAACEEMRIPFAVAERRHPVFCPRPRRISQLAAGVDAVRLLRWQPSHPTDFCDSKTGTELFDICLSKGEDQNQVAYSPPPFCGSPPSRASNPVVHDARFGEDRPPAPFVPSPITQCGQLPLSPQQGYSHAKLGLMPAAVRVEGFACLNRGRRGCSSISAVA